MTKAEIAAKKPEMLKMRENGLSNADIAKRIGCSVVSVYRHIGSKRQNAPSEPLEPQTDEIVDKPSPEPQKGQRIETTDIHAFAVLPRWAEKLKILAEMAQTEKWAFASPTPTSKIPEFEILNSQIRHTFRRLVEEYNSAEEDHDKIIYIRKDVCCFHTGLYTPAYEAIYALFTPNQRPDIPDVYWWIQGFYTADRRAMDVVKTLPEHRSLRAHRCAGFDPSLPLQTRTKHLLDRPDGECRLPEAVQRYFNPELLVETAVELARRKAAVEPDTVVKNLVGGCETGYLLPLYMTNPTVPDLAACVMRSPDGYNVCKTVLTLQQAYLSARAYGRPTASWLTGVLASR